MTVLQAREAAWRWLLEETTHLPEFRAAYTAGSTNLLPDDAELPAASDLDLMVVLAGRNQSGRRGKFIYRDALLDVTYLKEDQFQSPDQVLSDYHLAPSLQTAKLIFDPGSHLVSLRAALSRDYNKRRWVRKRCANAADKVLRNLQSIDEDAPLHDQVIASLFAAGVITHIVLVAGLRNPTVRTRYVEVRRLLARYGHLAFHETLLDLLGSARISPQRVNQHVSTLTEIFDVTRIAIRSPFPFASDLSDCARPIAIDGSLQLLESGHHREAMFWVAISHSRCLKVLSQDAPPDVVPSFRNAYRDLLADLGLGSSTEVRRRRAQIERAMPRVHELAEAIIAANGEIDKE